MSWNKTYYVSKTSASISNDSSTIRSPSSLTRDYAIQPLSSSAFYFRSSPNYIDEQATREREESKSCPPPSSPPSPYSYYQLSNSHLYSPACSSRVNASDAYLSNTTCHYLSQTSSCDLSSSFQSPFVYEQYLASLKSEQSEQLPYLFDNIIYPQPCSPPSPTNETVTYYQLDQTNTSAACNKFPQNSHIKTIQPITYQQLSLVEPPSSNVQQKLPIIKRFHYDSTMSNTTTTTIMTTTPIITNMDVNNQSNLPYARLDSTCFGTYDIWQERTVIGRKTNRNQVDIDIGLTSVVSRIHFELLLVNGSEFHLKCLSKNGIFINHNYTNTSSTTILPKQCTFRFPSTDISISFSSLLNHIAAEIYSQQSFTNLLQQPTLPSSIPNDIKTSISLQSVLSTISQQQVTVDTIDQQTQQILNHKSNNSLPSLITNEVYTSSSSFSSSLSTDNCTELIKLEHENSTLNDNSFLGSSISSCSTSPKTETNNNQPITSSPIIQPISLNGVDNIQQEYETSNFKATIKPPFSYSQLIVQAILSSPDKQMTLNQIYNFISAQYPYYAANNRGWQNSIRHNLSLNRYFIRHARKDNESGKGSFWHLDKTCQDKLIDHAFQCRKQRRYSVIISTNSNIKNEFEKIHSPNTPYCNESTDFLLADVNTSNSSTPLSPITSPLNRTQSPNRQNNHQKRKRDDNDDLIHHEIEQLLNSLIESIDNNTTNKRQKT